MDGTDAREVVPHSDDLGAIPGRELLWSPAYTSPPVINRPPATNSATPAAMSPVT